MEKKKDKSKENKKEKTFNELVVGYISENIKSFEDFKGSKRLKDEKFSDYKIRRKAEQIYLKIYLKGRPCKKKS